jgi:dihydrofolate synthase / folylpolyglutamate synthase
MLLPTIRYVGYGREMTYEQARAGMMARGAELGVHRKFDLAHMRALAAAVGDPEKRFRSVLIAGTNGKGSTAATLASILRAAGVRVGLYTSPHLERMNERIVVDGRAIGDEEFARVYERVEMAAEELVREGVVPHAPSFFEMMTAMAFVHFADAGVEIAVLEVGMGGRLDATNIVEPLVSVVTDIALDHMEWLGPTLSEIAREKAGILREGGTMVTLPQHPEVNEVLGEAATRLNVRGVNAAEYLPRGRDEGRGNIWTARVMGNEVVVASPLRGQHQQRNVANAIAAAVELAGRHGVAISAEQIAAGVAATEWPARLEMWEMRGRRVLLDVAHNPAGAWTLRAALAEMFGDGGGEGESKSKSKSESKSKSKSGSESEATLLFGCLKDKPVVEMAAILFPMFGRVMVTRPGSARAAELEDMLAAGARVGAEMEAVADPAAALERAIAMTPEGGLVVIAGSVYLAGELRGELRRRGARIVTNTVANTELAARRG